MATSVDFKSQRKLALVIGISEYAMGNRLANDAKQMALALEKIGFEVHDNEAKINLTYKEMRRTVTDFTCSIESNDTVLFYFAGYGTRWEGQNYLIPVDDYKQETEKGSKIKVPLSGSDLKKYAINLQNLLNDIADHEPSLTICFFDCSRTYPLHPAESNHSHGLIPMPAKVGLFIAYVCAPETTVDDENNVGTDGLFTKHLIQHLQTPNEDLRRVLNHVVHGVVEESNKQQIPHVISGLTEKYVCLNDQKQDVSSLPIESLSVSTAEEDVFALNKPIHLAKNSRFDSSERTVAGGNERGEKLNQLNDPLGFFIAKNKTLFIADQKNHRIVQWKSGEKEGEVVAGGNGQGNRMDQLDHPTDVIVDEQSHSLIITDQGNRRVIRWLDRQTQETLIENIHCSRLTMDKYGFLYVSDWEKDEVRRWKLGEKGEGELVAGGNGKGRDLNQLNGPTHIFVDANRSIYVSDFRNRRVVKWTRGADKGVDVSRSCYQKGELFCPRGLFVDAWDQVYVADWGNHKIIRMCKDSSNDITIDPLDSNCRKYRSYAPAGLSFDIDGNLYISDTLNSRIVRLNLML